MLSRTGYIIENNDMEVKKELTVRPLINNEFGFPPPPFKVFKQAKKNILCVPRFYGCEKFGIPENDKRPEPAKLSDGVTFKGKLREKTCQIEAFTKGVEQGYGVLSLPCGYGKTTVALAIASHLKLRTMIIVHKTFLANQWKERIEEFCPGATIGMVQQNKVEVECDFIIALLQSLSQREYDLNYFENIGTVIVDEAHHICARSFSQSLFKICPKHIYGLSATPDRKDGLTKILHWFMGPTFFSVERTQQKQVEVFTINFTCDRFKLPPPTMKNGKPSLPEMITNLTELPERNKILIDLVKKASSGTRQLIVLTDRRNHCEYLHGVFPETSGIYMGGMKKEDLEESSKKKIIFATFSQAHEGLDIPTLDSLILATPKSDIKQSIGRIMRETSGKKNNPQIWDIRDQWDFLSMMYNKRRKIYREGGFIIDSQEPKVENNFKGKCYI